MEWSRPEHQGITPEPRAGHAGVTVGENWFITGGGNNKKGKDENPAPTLYYDYDFQNNWAYSISMVLSPLSVAPYPFTDDIFVISFLDSFWAFL